jgi:hypothetical protein
MDIQGRKVFSTGFNLALEPPGGKNTMVGRRGWTLSQRLAFLFQQAVI